MYKLLLVIIMTLFTACTFSDTEHLKALNTEALAKESHEGKIYKDIVYKSTLFHNVTLDIYEPLNMKYEKAPIYIYIHGGSWLRGNKELVNVYDKTVLGLREAGVAVVSINYRFVSQSGISAMVSDCTDAVVFLQENAETYSLDAHTIGLHGHSAGANLALVTGLQLSKKQHDILFIVDEYGPSNAITLLKEQDNRIWWTYLISDSALEEISPILMLHPHTPPMYIAHGDVDVTVPITQSIDLYEALKERGSVASLHILKGADHGYKGLSDAVIQIHRQEVLDYMLSAYTKGIN